MSIRRNDTWDKPRWKDVYQQAPVVPYISKGEMTLKVPMTLFAENRKRLVAKLRKVRPHALVVIQAVNPEACFGKSSYVQDFIFFWAFGYHKPRAMGAIDVVSNKSYLIVSRGSSDGAEWCEQKLKRKEIKERFLVDDVWYLDELDCLLSFLKSYNDCREILILNYQRRDMPASIFKYDVDYLSLELVIRQLIEKKTKSEIKILQYISKHLEGALMHIMQRFRPGMTDNQLQAWFSFFMSYKSDFSQLSFCIFSGSDHIDYHFYGKRLPVNKRQRVFKKGELCVIEAGASYFGYKLSLGIMVPVSENFDKFQEQAYETVLRMRICVCRVLKSGMPVDEVQRTAEKALVHILIESRLLYGTIEGAFEHGVGKLLIPYKVVQSMDVECKVPKLLELGKTYVIQSGCYFTKSWLQEAYNDPIFKKYLPPEIRNFEDIVVKVSDPVIITTDGFRFLSDIPRASCTIREIRSEDHLKRSDFTITQVRENLLVNQSSFRIKMNE